MQDKDIPSAKLVKHPWIALQTSYDVEAWIDSYNRDLQRVASNGNANGYGICFHLTQGGEIFMHTTPDGDVLLDVTPEAEWVAPLITAATEVPSPLSQIWALPGHTLTQLILGLSALIDASSIVLAHEFKLKRKY